MMTVPLKAPGHRRGGGTVGNTQVPCSGQVPLLPEHLGAFAPGAGVVVVAGN